MSRQEKESGGGDENQTEVEILLEEWVVALESEVKKAEEQDGAKKEAVKQMIRN